MARIELSQKAIDEWDASLNPEKFLQEEAVGQVKNFISSYDFAEIEAKKAMLLDLAKTFSKIMQVDISQINLSDDYVNNLSGYYDNIYKSVTMFLKESETVYANSLTVLVTILHELRHAYQDQILVREDSDFGKAMRYYSHNYISFDDRNWVNTTSYKTNLLEVDAQRFSYATAKAYVEEIMKGYKNEKSWPKRIFNVKLMILNSDYSLYEKDYLKFKNWADNFDSIYENLLDYFKSLISQFYEYHFESKEQETVNVNLILDSFNQLLDSKGIKSIRNLTQQELAQLYMDILQKIKPENLVTKLDSELTTMLSNLGKRLTSHVVLHRKEGNNLVIYNDYFEKIKEGLDFGKIFLDKFNIKYERGNNKDIYLKYSNQSFKYLSSLLNSSEISEFDSMLADNLLSLELRDPNNFSRQKLLDNILKNYSEKEIKEILKSNIENDNQNNIINLFQLNSSLFDGYGNSYQAERKTECYSSFLNFAKVEHSNNFDEILSKFNEVYPTFFVDSIKNSELSEQDSQFIMNLSTYYVNDHLILKKIVEELKKQYPLEKLKTMFTQDLPNPVIELLTYKGITIDNFSNNEPEKVNETSITFE